MLPFCQKSKRSRWLRLRVAGRATMAIVAVALALVGCGTPESSGALDGNGPGGLERTTVRVGVLPIVDTAAVQRAQAAGYYAAEGLSVDLETVQGGAVGIPQMVSGDLDMTWSSWPSVIAAQHQRVADLRALPGGSYSAAADTFVMLAKPNSAIRTPQDLTGKKIAVNTFGSITGLVAQSALQTNGVDPNSVKFVEIPFPDMVAALDTGQVDAIVVVEPQLTQAFTQVGAVTVLDVASGPTADLPEAGLVTTAGFAQANPRTLAAFERALARAQADMADRSVVEQTLPTYTKITPDTAPLMRVGTWPTLLTTTNLQRIADLMQHFGQLPERFDVGPLLTSPA